ncbi:hypothetical protein GCM10009687_55320 [Asanoa iriomotensis]|uniref:Uncharacterized protein n=1 Tax=Asanoa iriomotensis TaxID=234613 RepID=A0ABQ4C5Q4_9ACTN|nr:hypothetical protein Air01nite_42070 [Asanoa iriomotensis]
MDGLGGRSGAVPVGERRMPPTGLLGRLLAATARRRGATEEVEERRVDVRLGSGGPPPSGHATAPALVSRPRPRRPRSLEHGDRTVARSGHELVVGAVLIKIRLRVVT